LVVAILLQPVTLHVLFVHCILGSSHTDVVCLTLPAVEPHIEVVFKHLHLLCNASKIYTVYLKQPVWREICSETY